MIIDFSICRGIFNGNVYVLCPQDFSLQAEHIYNFFPRMLHTYHTHL